MRFTEDFQTLYVSAVGLATAVRADAVLLLLDDGVPWGELKARSDNVMVIVAVGKADHVKAAAEAGLSAVLLEMEEQPVYDKVSAALLKSIADEMLVPGARVVALYSGFEAGNVDSVSIIDLGDHLGRLTVRDLRELEARVPLDTLQTVVNVCLEIGREGREGKRVGTLFVVGDATRVRRMCHAVGFDPMKGYSRKERNLKLARVKEGVKEIAQMDGAFVVAADGTVEAAAQYIDAPATDISLSKGLGSRHWAAASISRATKAVAFVVSESSGTLRIFQDGEVLLRIEPFHRPLKWKEMEIEPPGGE